MKRLRWDGLLSKVPLLLALCAGLAWTAGARDLVVRGGYFFDSVGDKVRKNEVIVVKSGRFFAVGKVPDGLDVSKFETISLSRDDYILPGIVDVHAHYRVSFNRKRWDDTEVNPVVYLANGVTSTFPAGEINPHEMMALRKEIDRGERPGPRIFNSGPYFGTAQPGWKRNTTVEEIYDLVDEWAEHGVGGLKAKGITREHLKALIDRGHQHGLTVSVHLGSGYRGTVNPKDAILMGMDRVEHFLGGDALPPDKSAYASLQHLDPKDPAVNEIIRLYVEHQVVFDATLTAYGYFGDRAEGYDYWVDERKFLTPYARELTKDVRPFMEQFDRIYKVKRKTIKKAFDAGVFITLGTDHQCTGEFLPGFGAHRELDAFVLAGIPPAEAIKIATINGARALKVGDRLGTIEVGKLADFFITKGNPLKNIRNTRKVHTVVKGGELFHTQDLLKSVEGKLGPKSEGDLESR